MRRIVLGLVALFALGATASAETVPFDSPRWRLAGQETRLVEHDGRQAVFLRGASATLADADFDTGVVSFDIWTDGQRGFPGLYFRGVDDSNAENFYIRPHQSGNPDANQYQPVINGATAWQIFYGEEFAQPVRYAANAWMHIRIEIADDSARVFIDSDTPSLVIHDLKRERARGYLALTDGGDAGVYFANFSYTPGEVEDAPPEPARDLPPGLVRAWHVSAPMAESAAFEAARANRLNQLAWTPVPVETIGVANLARAGARTREAATVLARISVNSDRARTVRMRFGFSDRVRLYLNGVAVFDGDDTYRSRDYRFLGTVGLFDAAHLPLRRGRNEIVMAVTEGFGGWAAMAAFDEMDGLTLLEH